MSVPLDLLWAKKYPSSVDWSANIPARPLYEIFDDAVRTHPDNVFLDFLGKTTTYRAAADYVARAAKGLQDMGVKKGDRVGLMLPNSPYYVFMYFAALKIGATVVNFNPLYAAQEVEKQVKDSGCRVMATVDVPSIYGNLSRLIDQSCLEKIVVCRMTKALPPLLARAYPYAKYIDAARAIAKLRLGRNSVDNARTFKEIATALKRQDIVQVKDDAHNIDFERLANNKGDFAPVPIDPEKDLAVLQYTGGTTGTPKGAMLTHANLSINAVQTRNLFPNVVQGQEVMMGVLPFFHVFAMTAVLNVTILLASKIILLPRFDLKQVIKVIDKKRPTLFPAVPTIYTAINNFKKLGKYNLKSLKFCFSGGAPLPVEVKRDFERLTGCVVVEGYG
ncbi:MAG: AMP-binding protein, partial [Alphaproteobacteria bacterium]